MSPSIAACTTHCTEAMFPMLVRALVRTSVVLVVNLNWSPLYNCRECKQLCVDLQTKLEVVRRDLQHERRRTAVMKTRKPTSDRSTSTTSPAPLPPACHKMSDRGTQTVPTSTSGRSHPDEQDGRHQVTNASTQTSTAQPTSVSSHPSSHSSSRPPEVCPSGGTPRKRHHFRTLSEGSSLHRPLEEVHTHSQRKGKPVDSGTTSSKTPQCLCGLHKCLEDSFRLVKLKEEIKTFKLKCKELEKQVHEMLMMTGVCVLPI